MACNRLLLESFDRNIRGEIEAKIGLHSAPFGQLWVSQFVSWFITAGPGHSLSLADLRKDSKAALEWISARPPAEHRRLEWKTYGHHLSEDLRKHLAELGLEAKAKETLMVGNAEILAKPVEINSAISIRAVVNNRDLASDCQQIIELLEAVFGRASGRNAKALEAKALQPQGAFYLAESQGRVVGVGRIILDGASGWAGLWGGCVNPAWRGRGIYRALLAARAQWALERNVRLIRSDCSAMSQPILDRAGLDALTTTTSYVGPLPELPGSS